MPEAMADRRGSPRYALILIAVVTDLECDAKLSARTSDVSRMGCYVDTLNPVPKGKAVYVVLSRGDETFEARGRVMYVSPGLGMGIKFDEPVDPEQLAKLSRWLERASPLRF